MKIYKIKETICFTNKDYIIIITEDNKIFKYGRKSVFAKYNDKLSATFPYLAVCDHGATRTHSKNTQVTNDDMYFYAERLESTQLFEEVLGS